MIGVAFLFPFLLTLPGWWGLQRYREWRDGKRGTPRFLIAWGIVGPLVLVAVTILSSAVMTTAPPVGDAAETSLDSEVAVNTPGVALPDASGSSSDIGQDQLLTDVGDCARVTERDTGDFITVTDCSSPNASLVAVKVISFLRSDVPSKEDNHKRIKAVAAAALQSCPHQTLGWTDEGLQIVCWASW